MFKSGIDQDAMIVMFSQATAQQGEALRKAVSEATLKALQGRELTLANIRGVVEDDDRGRVGRRRAERSAVARRRGCARQAFAGMDAALLKAVEAHRRALEQIVGQAWTCRRSRSSRRWPTEKMEDMFGFTAVAKAAQSGGRAAGSVGQDPETMKLKGTSSGMLANQSVERMLAQTQTACATAARRA